MGLVNVIDKNMLNKMTVNDDGSINVNLSGGADIDVDSIKKAIEEALSNLDVGDIKVTGEKMVLTRSYKGNDKTDYKLNEPHHHITVANDDTENSITLVVNGLAIEINAWEVFDDEFDPFTEFKIENEHNVEFRVLVKKRVSTN